MSIEQLELETRCQAVEECAAIELVVQPKLKDLGGFTVNRCLPVMERRSVGPWVFFDEMGPAMLPPGSGINVRPHPHVNLATVTYLFDGEVLHKDSLGTFKKITPGAINLMVAGKGIVHSEREAPDRIQQSRGLYGFQLWMALPEASEEMEPEFHHYPADKIPSVAVNGVPVRVLIGRAYGVVSPVKEFYRTLYLEAQLLPGQTLELPNESERGLYIANGELKIRERQYSEKQMIILSDADGVTVTALQPTTIVLIGGEKISKRYMEWNFISSRKERIEQAKRDWVEGKFPIVPGDEDEFIPLPGANKEY
ncbi:pirin family protein [Rheinheimera nanhaiensis]|uniref:Pirin-like protein CC_3178 n=1 Tax=Rheinheimera nanhaiensis E407-8 TaxID=562729 RepID=I1DVC4_9GAMM|nr:pirin family protein [Rheinheimera nanhaiensis]GAB58002.1 pirin-like protein CC_3178 [Rheinheimera nanhaiensis E407-8]